MSKPPRKHFVDQLVLELGKAADGSVAIVASIPGRQDTAYREWAPGASWDDVRLSLDVWVSQWLTMAGGWQESFT